MEIVAGFFVWRGCLADVDEWGDLRALRGDGGVLRRLDEAEREEFGETLWESWQRLEREGKIDPQPAPAPEPPPDADEEARRQRERAEWWIEYLPEPDMPVVLAFLAWRGRQSLRPWGGPAVRMAAAGAEAMRLTGEAERKLAGKRIYGKNPDPQPGDFDDELEAMDPRDIECHPGNPDAKLIVLPGMDAGDVRLLAELAVERGKSISELLLELAREET
jgi:hypothetical protein